MSDACKFHLEDLVYSRLDPEARGIVTGIVTRPTGFQYLITWNDREETTCFACELTSEPNFAAKD